MIRDGGEKDVPRIVEMAENFWHHTIYDDPYSPDAVEAMSLACIEQDLMAVLQVDGVVQGFACGVKGPLLANHEVFQGTELAWWVEPEHRKGKNGIGLLRHLEELAKHAGVKYWNMIYMMSSMPEIIEGIYDKMGYTKSEVVYTKVL